MMKKTLTLGITALAAAGLAAIGSLNVSALNTWPMQGNGHGYQSSLKSHAKVVDMTVDELRKALETKTMPQIAVDKDISEAASARWASRGLSTSEIAERAQRKIANATGDHRFGSGNNQAGHGCSR